MRRLPDWLLGGAVVAPAAALWLPWVWHRAAALVLAGLDLPEFVRFMGEVNRGEVLVYPIAFWLPLIVLALADAAAAALRKLPFWSSVVALAAAIWLLSVAFPPRERGPQLLASALVLAACHGVLRMWRPRAWVQVLCLGFMAGTGAVCPLAQFWVLTPSLSRLYGRSVIPGAGVYLAATGPVLAALGIITWAVSRKGELRGRR